LIENGANIHARNDQALSFAISFGYLEVVKYLVENGANINVSDFLFAVKHFEVLKYLIEYGANINEA